MNRQSISFTATNADWIKEQIDRQEYSSKSELINDLVRRERRRQQELEWIRRKLEASEESGFSTVTPEALLAEFKERQKKDG